MPTYLNNINVQYNRFEGPTIYKLIEQKLQLLKKTICFNKTLKKILCCIKI